MSEKSEKAKKNLEKNTKHVKAFWADFKKFITRGNIIDLAVGVVIGGSFSKIVTGLVNYIINPFVALFIQNGSLDMLKSVITPAVIDENGTEIAKEVAILWGTWLQTILDFLITALCIFVILRLIMNAKKVIESSKIEEEKKKAAQEKEKAEAEKKAAEEKAALAAKQQVEFQESIMAQERLLTEIRDLLKNK